jgi:hypothetical protein
MATEVVWVTSSELLPKITIPKELTLQEEGTILWKSIETITKDDANRMMFNLSTAQKFVDRLLSEARRDESKTPQNGVVDTSHITE